MTSIELAAHPLLGGRQLALARVVALLGGAPDLALEAPSLELQDAHSQDRLGGDRLFLRRERHVGDERGQRRLVLGQAFERVVEVVHQVLTRAARCLRGELVVGRPGEVVAAQVPTRQAASQELALRAKGNLAGGGAGGQHRPARAGGRGSSRGTASGAPGRTPRARRDGPRSRGPAHRASQSVRVWQQSSCVPPQVPCPCRWAYRVQHRQVVVEPETGSLRERRRAAR